MLIKNKKIKLNTNLVNKIIPLTLIVNNSSKLINKNQTLISKLESILEDCDENKQKLINYLKFGKTYEALEIVNLYENNLISQEIITEIAYWHYKKMKRSHIKSKYLNEHIMKYPKVEYFEE